MTIHPAYTGAANEALERKRIAFAEEALASQRGSLPAFWPDAEVRRFLIAQRGFLTLDMARERLASLFGSERAPSRSAINRFWLLLDQLDRSS